MQKSKEKKILGTVPKNYQMFENFWDCPEFSKEEQNQKGITLIALVITIIVMLILVGVTINVALNGGLFTKADDAVKQTQLESEKEILQNTALGFLETNGEINFAQFETEYAGKTVEGYTIKSEGEYASATKGETVFYINKHGGISGEKPAGKEYTFTLNQLKEGGYEEADNSRISFEADYMWSEVIKEDLSSNEKYVLNDSFFGEDILLFAIESSDGVFTNYFPLISDFVAGNPMPDAVRYIVFAELSETGERFNIAVMVRADDEAKEFLSDTPKEGQMTVEEFLESYGDVEFRFVDVSSVEIPSGE